MEFRKISDNEITARLQSETASINMSQQEKENIIQRLKKKNNPIGRFMEQEFVIPVKALIAGCAIVVISAFIVFFPMLRVSEEDIQESKVIIIHQEGAV